MGEFSVFHRACSLSKENELSCKSYNLFIFVIDKSGIIAIFATKLVQIELKRACSI